MGRYTGPTTRLSRREGVNLMLKPIRDETGKNPLEREYKNYPPGAHMFRRGKASDYAVRLREKQKVKRHYGLFEGQFLRYFRQAERSRDNTGEALLTLLERRLDNVVCKAGLAPSRKSARVMICHGHVRVNGRRVDRAGFLVSQGDRVDIKPSDRSRKLAKTHLELTEYRPPQPWLQVDAGKLEVTVAALPSRDDVQIPVEVLLIVEMCGR